MSRLASRRLLLLLTLLATGCLIYLYLFLSLGGVAKGACPPALPSSSLVPCRFHFVQFDSVSFPFVSFLCLLSVSVRHPDCPIEFHTNVKEELSKQSRFKRIQHKLGSQLILRSASKPTHVFGLPLGNVYHANDVFKISLAYEEGGVFLDQDTFLIRDVTPLLQHEVTLGRPKGEDIGIQFIACQPKARFIKAWLESYRDYRASMWYYNAGRYPTEKILKPCPDLAHIEEERLGVHNLADKLYGEEYWDGWRNYYALHLLNRHRDYLSDDGIKEFDESNILTYNRTFGVIARELLKISD